jgi:2-polyprenyl-6-methoxyphenol hydroxylase-like FAD-dependent oxidoreductase
MKPMIGLIRKRAKAGMTIPAAPRMTSASLKPEVWKSDAHIAFMPERAYCQPWPGGKTTSSSSAAGPAGMVAGLLFARAGVPVTVLEKHGDFLRDFRGDTVHPSTLRIFHELGLLDRLLERPHDKVRDIHGLVGGRHVEIADFSHFDPRWNFIAMMPQWEFLDFVADEARAYPHFSLLRNAEATDLVEEAGRVRRPVPRRRRGAGNPRPPHHRRRRPYVAPARGGGTAGRTTSARRWTSSGSGCRKERAADNQTTGVFASGRIMALIDRGDYWQCAYVFPKGMAEEVKARGIEAFREEVAGIAPMLRERIGAVATGTTSNCSPSRSTGSSNGTGPGLLVIGDAAHAMSPIGGVGINVAVQDAVAAANALAGPMAAGADLDPLLGRVEKRRLPAVRITQGFQRVAQQRIISPLLMRAGGDEVLGHEAGLDLSTQTFSSVSANFASRALLSSLARCAGRGPGEDRGDRVGRGLLALLVLAVVARHRAVRGLGLDTSCRPASSAPRSSGRASRSPAPRCRTARRRRSSCRPRRSRPTTSAPRRPCRRSGGARR